MLVAYADESGTEDKLGHKAAVSVSAFGGYVASYGEWAHFCDQWQRILDEYDAPFFHFREWAMASAIVRKKRRCFSAFNKNPYYGWKLTKLDSFLLELAEVAGTRKEGTFGGYISTAEFNARKAAGDILIGEDHRDYCLKQCFEAFVDAVNSRWPHFSEPISFFWDWTDDPKWMQSIHEAYGSFKKKDSRLTEITFADDKDRLPLQAADMVAYRMRQWSDKLFKGEHPIMSDIDKALFGNGKTGRLLLRNTS
jgi:hypothetical protein